jgi:ribosomal protein S18 acetylase RimI-like enzyme
MRKINDTKQKRIEKILFSDMEKLWGLPLGALCQGATTYSSQDSNITACTAYGNSVICIDHNLALNLSQTISICESEDDHVLSFNKLQDVIFRQHPNSHCSLDLALYCHKPPSPFSIKDGIIERMTPQEVIPDLAELAKNVFAIKVNSKIVSYSWNIPQLKTEGFQFHAIGVKTMPDYRNQGFGKAVVTELLRYIMSDDNIALWCSDVKNIPSLKLAHSVGFTDYMLIFNWRL